MDMNEFEVRRIAMELVRGELAPIAAEVQLLIKTRTSLMQKLERIEKWSLELFGNGSGRPGYMEKARAEDLSWKNEVLRKVEDLELQKALNAHEAKIRAEYAEIAKVKLRDKRDTWTILVAALSAAGGIGLFKGVAVLFHLLQHL